MSTEEEVVKVTDYRVLVGMEFIHIIFVRT